MARSGVGRLTDHDARLGPVVCIGLARDTSTDFTVAGERGFEQVSQGNTTDGWVVFEVPNSLNPASLAVLVTRPEATPAGNEQQPPQYISLLTTDEAEATESP